MERLSKATLSEFLARLPFAVVHVDAEWDWYRLEMARRFRAVEPQFDQRVSFGYMDADTEQDYAKDIGLLNVPSIAYYKGLTLVGVVISFQQDLKGNIERLMRGEELR